MDLLFCGTGWLSDTSFLLITFYYLGYYGGYCADFVLTETKIARKSYGFGEVTRAGTRHLNNRRLTGYLE